MSAKNWVRFILLGLIWGSSYLWIKLALKEVGPFTLVFLRVLFGFIGVFFIMLRQKTQVPWRKRWKFFVLLGVFNLAMPFFLISWAEKYITSGVVSVLGSIMPLWTVLLVAIFLPEERLTAARWGGVLLGFAGVVVLMSDQLGELGSDSQLGILAILASSLLYALSAVLIRLRAKNISSDALTFGQLLVAWFAVMPGVFLTEAPFNLPQLPLTWISLLWLGFLGSCLALVIYFAMLHEIGPARTVQIVYVQPLIGVALGALFLGEALDWRLVVGGVMILLGVWWVNRRSK